MKSKLIIGVVSIIILIILGVFLFLPKESFAYKEEIAKCKLSDENATANDCLTNLAIEKESISVCENLDESSEDDEKELCEYQYYMKVRRGEAKLSEEEIEKMKAECGTNQHCLLQVARLANDPEICQEISDGKIKSECLIYTAGYSEEELKDTLLTNKLNLDVNARIFGLRSLTGFSCQNVPFLLEIMQDEDSLIRFKAVQYMGENKCYFVKLALNEEEVMNRIVWAYNAEQDMYVKARVIHTLGELGSDKTIPFIEETLRNDQTSDFLKISCLTALGSIGGQKSLDILNDFKDDTNELIRLNARRSINTINECSGDSCLPLN